LSSCVEMPSKKRLDPSGRQLVRLEYLEDGSFAKSHFE
jgi:hypothetical protein